MQNALVQLVIFGIQQLIAHAPELWPKIQAVIGKKDVTVAELQALRNEIEGDTYEKLVPHSQLNNPVLPPDIEPPLS